MRRCSGLPAQAVEAREEAVAGRVELGAAEARELAADKRVVLAEQLAPARIPELRRLRRRSDDVREEHRCEHAVRLRLFPGALLPGFLQETFELSQGCVRVAREERVIGAGDFHVPRSGDVLDEIARGVDGEGVLAGTAA